MEKKIYFIPKIERIIVDAQISLELESEPPPGPDETHMQNVFKSEAPLLANIMST